MSRCFPFPPPGYEKKARPDDAELLKKEKHKEKKHKKDKKDKEKREGKEKREKERSDGKHREKKDKKEKYKDRKKDKEKDKDREKSSTSEEKRVVAGKLEGYNGEKLQKKEDSGKEKTRTPEQTKVFGQFEGCNGGKLHQKEELGIAKISSSVEKKPALQFQGESPIQKSLLADETGDRKFVVELGGRIRDEEKGTGEIQLAEGFRGPDWKKDEGIERSAVKDNAKVVAQVKEKNKDTRVDNKKMDEPRFSGVAMAPNLIGTVQNRAEGMPEPRFSGIAMAPNLIGNIQSRAEGMPRPVEKKIEKTTEKKEKSKERGGDEKRGEKRKSKDKDREKEKKKAEKAKEKSEHKKTEKDKTKNSNKNDLIGVLDNKISHLSKDSERNAAVESNLKKRKDTETNGVLHDNEHRPTKMPRLTSNLSAENGKKLEPCQTPSLVASVKQGEGAGAAAAAVAAAAINLVVENKGQKAKNDTLAAPPLSLPPAKPPPAPTKPPPAPTKPPHPDTKYLSQVLAVPKMEEWSDFDDQEWLFSNKASTSKKPDVGPIAAREDLKVWAEALPIESADICALPYVIPY